MCVTTANSLLQVEVDSVTGRDESLINGFSGYLLYEISSILGDEGPAEEVF